MRKMILLAVVLAPLVVACHQSTGVLDAIKPGTPVTVKTSGGQTISGELKESRPDALVVQPPNGAPTTIPRSQISALTISTNAEATRAEQAPAPIPAPPADGSAATGQPEANGPGPDASRGGSSAAVPTSQPAAEPQWREVTVPAGTALVVRLDESLASDRSRPEEPVRATLVDSVVVHGVTAVPAGSLVAGNVTSAKRSGKVKGVAELAIRFDSLRPKGSGEDYKVRTGLVARRARAQHRRDALEIGGPAAGGAILGGILGGKKGALIGTTVGGGAGTAVVLNQRGQEVRLPAGTRLRIKLLDAITVRVPA